MDEQYKWFIQYELLIELKLTILLNNTTIQQSIFNRHLIKGYLKVIIKDIFIFYYLPTVYSLHSGDP